MHVSEHLYLKKKKSTLTMHLNFSLHFSFTGFFQVLLHGRDDIYKELKMLCPVVPACPQDLPPSDF